MLNNVIMTTSGVMGEQVEEGEVNYESLHTDANLSGSLAAVKGAKSNSSSALQVSTSAVRATGDFDVATDKFTVASSTGNTVVAGTLTKGSNSFPVATMGQNGTQALSAVASFISITLAITTLGGSAIGNITHTMADGEEGQIKYIKMITNNGNDTFVQPTNFYNGTNIKFNAVDLDCWLIFTNGNWMVINNHKNVVIA